MGQDLSADFKLLRYIGRNPCRVRACNDGPCFGAEYAFAGRAVQCCIKVRHGFEHLDAVSLGLQPLVDLEERDNLTFSPSLLCETSAFFRQLVSYNYYGLC